MGLRGSKFSACHVVVDSASITAMLASSAFDSRVLFSWLSKPKTVKKSLAEVADENLVCGPVCKDYH